MDSRSPAVGRESIQLRFDRAVPVPLLFVELDTELFVGATGSDPSWAKLAAAGRRAIVEGDGIAPRVAYPRLVDLPAVRDRFEAAIREKYGDGVWDRYFHGTLRIFCLDPRPARDGPGERLRCEFDAAAPDYGARVASDPVQRELRRRSVAWLTPRLDGRDPVLEIGSGTGLETLPLLLAGHHVVSVDISPAMREALHHLVEAAGVANRWAGVEGDLADLAPALGKFPEGAFQGAWSTFGAFNLVPDLTRSAAELHRVLRPGAPLLIGTLNRWAPVSWAYSVAEGGVGRFRDRLRDPIPAGAWRYGVEVFPRSPAKLARELSPRFRRLGVESAAAALPSFRSARLERWIGPQGGRRLLALDDGLRRLPGMGWLAEWSFVEFRRA